MVLQSSQPGWLQIRAVQHLSWMISVVDLTFSADFMARLASVLGKPVAPVALHEPEFEGNEWNYVKECIDTRWVSSVGKYVDEFELRLAEFTGAKHAIAVSNGTAALQVALRVAGVGAGDEVLVPALTFVATANAVSHCGAIPHFVDSDPNTFGMCPDALVQHLEAIAEPVAGGYINRQTGRRLGAIVPMHVFGHPAKIEALLAVAERYKLPLVEDAAESLGSWIGDRHTGTFGQTGVLSFNGNKIITTGGGGAILTNDSILARHIKHLTTTAKLPHRWEFVHDEIAYNYRLPNLNAALGCAQLEQLPGMLSRKRELARAYREAFFGAPNFDFVDEPDGCVSNYWLNAIRLKCSDLEQRDALLETAIEGGYQCRPVWRLLSSLSMYLSCPRADLVVASELENSLINLPSSPSLAGLLKS